jgi:hypothetical protein
MSYYQYLFSIRTELDQLNQIIDQRIMQRLPYDLEARRHQELLKELRSCEPRHFWQQILTSLFA